MTFRKLYWVTEQVDANGSSCVTGVYTSIPHLIHDGLGWQRDARRLRLSLVTLDSMQEPIHSWSWSCMGDIAQDLQEFVETEEFSMEHICDLDGALRCLDRVAA